MPFVCHERHPTPFDIPMRWKPQRELMVRALRVAFADFSAAPWQGLEKSERCPNNSSLHSLFCRYATSSPGRGKSLATGRGRRRCCSSLGGPQNSIRHPLTFLCAGTRALNNSPPGCCLPCLRQCRAVQVLTALNIEKRHPLGGAFSLWASQDLNPGPSGYEPPALTN